MSEQSEVQPGAVGALNSLEGAEGVPLENRRPLKRSLPSVGRMVHYRAHGTPNGEYLPKARAAIITEVKEEWNPTSVVGLAVLNPTGVFFNREVPYGEDLPGHWSWPPYVPAVEY